MKFTKSFPEKANANPKVPTPITKSNTVFLVIFSNIKEKIVQNTKLPRMIKISFPSNIPLRSL